MIVVLNSSKTLDVESGPTPPIRTLPEYLDDAALLVGRLRKFSVAELGHLMGVSEKLARLNAARYKSWHTPFTPSNARPAILAYSGDVYAGMATDAYGNADFRFAQDHVRILAGLYGILKPLDLIQPYRLEMGTRFSTPRGDNLYDFWGERLTESLQRALRESKSGVLLNLASVEYLKAVDTDRLEADVITPLFKQERNGKLKTIAVYTKKARGMMCDYLIRNRITNPQKVKTFDRDGYRFDPQGSSKSEWLFRRS
jgi:cytoplasmic iron level regulating protein YaaA (DUF328/UPF0246 family)